MGRPRAGVRDALLLAARQRKDAAVGQLLQPQLADGIVRALAYALLGPRHALQRKRHLARGIHVEELRARVLEHRAHACGHLPAFEVGHVAPVHQHASLERPREERGRQPVRQPRHRGLAAAGRAAHEHAPARLHAQVDAAHPLGRARAFRRRAVREAHIVKLDHRLDLTAPRPTGCTQAPPRPRPRRRPPAARRTRGTRYACSTCAAPGSRCRAPPRPSTARRPRSTRSS